MSFYSDRNRKAFFAKLKHGLLKPKAKLGTFKIRGGKRGGNTLTVDGRKYKVETMKRKKGKWIKTKTKLSDLEKRWNVALIKNKLGGKRPIAISKKDLQKFDIEEKVLSGQTDSRGELREAKEFIRHPRQIGMRKAPVFDPETQRWVEKDVWGKRCK